MKRIIKQARESLKARSQAINKILSVYKDRYQEYCAQTMTLEKHLKEVPQLEATLREKLQENWQHLGLRVRDDCMPQMELLQESQKLKSLLQCFKDVQVLSDQHIKNYDMLCRMYLQNSFNEKNTLRKHEEHIESFVQDLKILSDFKKIKQYLKLVNEYQQTVAAGKKQVMQKANDYLDKVKL